MSYVLGPHRTQPCLIWSHIGWVMLDFLGIVSLIRVSYPMYTDIYLNYLKGLNYFND